jgi:excisionase family DNA binding protein
MNSPNLINPYLQMSRLVGRELDFGMVEHFVGKYIDDAIRHNGQSYSDASNDLKQFFVQLSDAIFQATVNYEDRIIPYQNTQLVEDLEENKEDKLLTVEDVADQLGVTPQMVRNYIKENKISAIKLSERKTKIRQSILDEFINSRR